MPTLERAISIAAEAHAGQVDKAGQPYILHPLRVMLRLRTEDERIAAVLHDVVEDTAVSIDQLAKEGFPKSVLDAVEALTKRPGESRMEAAARAAGNSIARAVKLADNAENMDLSRIADPTEKDLARLKEYEQVRALLLGTAAIRSSLLAERSAPVRLRQRSVIAGDRIDSPKTLGSETERVARKAMLRLPHVQDLAQFVRRMREAKGPEYGIPDFDPLDGGVDARVLFLLEAPGRRAVASGFISRNNPDETAKNFFLLNDEVKIDRRLTVSWNAVPWYIGSEAKIRAATRDDVRGADAWLAELLALLPKLRIVVFVGQKSLHAQELVRQARPDVEVIRMPHPSPLFINRAPGNRDRIIVALRELSTRLGSRGDAFLAPTPD